MKHISQISLPGLPAPKTYAPAPVWADSTTKDVPFRPLSRKDAVSLYRKARRLNRKGPRKNGGLVGSSALRVLECLLFDFLNHATGRLDPSYEAIARETGLGRATVWRALKRLRELGILNWVRRCSAVAVAGVFTLEQDTNAYAVLPSSMWRGFCEAVRDVLPHEWGAVPMLPDIVTQALQDGRSGDTAAMMRGLLLDGADPLAGKLASLARHFV